MPSKDTTTSATTTTSEGFDLDAMPNGGDDVVYELGGGVTTLKDNDPDPKTTTTNTTNDPETPSVVQKSEECKARGNTNFKNRNFLDAIDDYTDAIDACPGMSRSELLQLQSQHEEQEREKSSQRYQRDTDRRMEDHHERVHPQKSEGQNEKTKDEDDTQKEEKVKENNNKEEEEEDELAPKEFVPPPHPYGKYLSVYYSNRAACLIHMHKYSGALEDCNLAIMVQPTYVKAFIRRMTCHEKTDKVDLALTDAKKAQEFFNQQNGTSNIGCTPKVSRERLQIQNHVRRLQKLDDARMEQLKEETMGKLKDLGNSILGNFGMSLDNFQAQKDPKTGSYSISYNNN